MTRSSSREKAKQSNISSHIDHSGTNKQSTVNKKNSSKKTNFNNDYSEENDEVSLMLRTDEGQGMSHTKLDTNSIVSKPINIQSTIYTGPEHETMNSDINYGGYK